MYAGMRGLAGAAAIVALTTGLGVAGALDTSTAVIPFDLAELDFGRELTLLLTVAESPEACGPSDIQINGQPLSTRDGRFGRDTVYEDYGSELVASWALDCTEVDGTPAQQSITVQIDSLDGVDYDDLVFTVAFHQANPVAILDIDGPLVDFPALDLTGGDGRDFWAQHHGLEGDAGGEVAAAVSEMQFLRIQQREFGERIRVLEAFIEEADAEMGVCRGRFRCLMRSVLNKVTGMASNAYETVMGPGKSHGNGTHAVPPSRKRPLWRPPFCPCAPSSSPTGPPPEPVPEDSPTVDDEAVPDEPDVADQSPHIEPPRPETPQTPDDDAEDQDRKTSTSANKDLSTPGTFLLFPLIVLLIATTILLLRRGKEYLARRRRACVLRRRERRREHLESAISFFRRLLPGGGGQRDAPPCTAADMEQQVVPPPPPGDSQRASRAQSDASNTMEQDLAQFRAAVDMVGSLVAGGESSRDGEGGAVRRVGFGGGYPQDLPPAYESEEEDAPMLSAISDGFRPGYGSSGYTPGQGGSGGNADALGYAKP